MSAFPLCLFLVAAVSAFEGPLSSVPQSLRARLAAYNHPALVSSPSLIPARVGAFGASATPGVRLSPLDFGGDALGIRDSAPALQACVQACVNYSQAIDALGHFPGDASFGNGKYIANAGGCQIDLGGGEFMLSSPVLIPEYLGNLVLGHGSLIADDTPGVFPANSFLLVVGIEGSCKVPQVRERRDRG